MNILRWLTPKSEVDFVHDDASLNKTLRTMQNRNFAAVPIINKNGKYVGTISSGDILGCIKENFDLSIKASADFPVRNVKRTKDNKAVSVNATMDEVIALALTENFIPVLDDDENFIGIITRREIINWLYKTLAESKNAQSASDIQKGN